MRPGADFQPVGLVGINRSRNMSEIEQILNSGTSSRLDEERVVSESDVARLVAAVRCAVPPSYLEFLRLGGLAELRFHNRVLSPVEIVDTLGQLPSQCIPFADNGCGDVFCWERSEQVEPAVILWEHDSGKLAPNAANFVDWLRQNRF